MVYLGVYGYAQGNPSNIFRGVDQSGNVCGEGAQSNFPYLYLTNPAADLTKKSCVDKCPYWTGSAIYQVQCSNSANCNSNAYQVTYDTNGNVATGAYSTTAFVGYDSYLTLDRICIPNANMFTSVFSTISSSFSSAMSSGKLANFINDIKNVLIIRYRIGNGFWLLLELL